MTYFIFDSTGKLKISLDKTTIDEFTPNECLGTLDIVEYTYSIDRKKIDKLYRTYETQNKWGKTFVNQDDKIFEVDSCAKRIIRGNSPLDLNKGTHSHEIQIRKLLSPKPTEIKAKITFSFEELNQWKENFQAYYSSSISLQEEEVILKAKSLKPITTQQREKLATIGPLMTFVSDSRIYLDAKNNILTTPLEIKVFGFCYPEFRSDSWKQEIIYRKNRLYDTLKKIFKVNLQAIIYEAQHQNKKLPFLIFPPGSFISGLSEDQKSIVKKLIFYAFKEAKDELAPLVKEHISEFIALGGKGFWGTNLFSNQNDQPPTLVANADAIDIAKKLWQTHKIKCPIPIMANPMHPVGCGFLSTIQSSSTDEMLARYSGNLHGIILQERIAFCEKNPRIKDNYFHHLRDSLYTNKKTKLYEKFIFQPIDIDQSQTQFQISYNYNLQKIDINQVFAMAVKEATKGLNIFENYRNNTTNAKNLLEIMIFARDNQGVGNKDAQLRTSFPNATQDQINQIKLFSAKFQKQMVKYQIFTGNNHAKKIVGARLHRLATSSNILNFFKNNSNLEISFLYKKLGIEIPGVNPSSAKKAQLEVFMAR